MKRVVLILALSLALTDVFSKIPRLSFFCELRGKEFSELFADTALIQQLVDMNISLRVGLLDFNDERTVTIKKLNEAGIPMVAWLLLPEDEGYWFNMHNGDKAHNRYDDFRKWTTENNLKWEGIGIDLELDMNDARLAVTNPWKLAWIIYKRLYDNKSLENGKEIYQKLVTRMEADGYSVESYLIPMIYNEREKGTTSFQKLFGLVDIKTGREIPMLYTSAMGNPGIIPFYCTDRKPVGLGSTGGGVNIEGIELQALTWINLERDLLIASKLTDEIHIFCLEASVQKGFLDHIESLDFTRDAPVITVEIEKQRKMNRSINFFLTVLNHPLLLTIVFFTLIGLIIFGIYKLIRLIPGLTRRNN